MSRLSPVALAVVLAFQLQLEAQTNTSRLGREIDASRPRVNPEDEARRQAQNELADEDRAPDYIEGERLLRMPQGYYIIAPDKYRPDNWSPRIRPRNDYGPGGIGSAPRGLRYSHRYRDVRGGGRYSYPYDSYGRAYASDCYGCGSPFCTSRDVIGDAYVQGRYDADHEYQDYIASERAGRLLDANRLGVAAGIEHFQAGRYDRAAIEWIGASERNQGDAASRVFAGHALFAVGRYDEAVKMLSRAFELAPFLTESYYDVRTEYGNPDDFATHLSALKAYVAAHPNSAAAVTLLGYVVAYTDGPAAAHPFLERANTLKPDDFFVSRLFKISRIVTPMPGVERAEPATVAPSGRRQRPATATIRKAVARAGHD